MMSDKKVNRYTLPEQCHEAYSADDIGLLGQIIDWLNARPGRSKTTLMEASQLPEGTIKPLLAGSYGASPTEKLQQVIDIMLQLDEQQKRVPTFFVETQIYRTAHLLAKNVRGTGRFGVLVGNVGVGKTEAVKRLAKTQPNTWLVEATPRMNDSTFLNELLYAMDLPESGNRHQRFRRLTHRLKDTPSLIILDEAEEVAHNARETLRRLIDHTQIGGLMVGNEGLHEVLQRQNNVFNRLGSRSSLWPQTIFAISKADAQAMVHQVIPDISSDCFNTLWTLCGGSARMLVKNLLPAILEFCINQGHTLTPRRIQQCATQALSIPLPKMPGAAA